MLRQINRQGESTILGYVLLVVFAIGMATAVYSYLTFFLPKEQPRCPEGVSLAVSQARCEGQELAITLQNKGLFSVNGSYIKVGEKGRVYKELINCPGPQQHPPFCQIYFNTGPDAYLIAPLVSGDSWSATFNYTQGPGEREIEIEPFLIASKGLQTVNASIVLCPAAIITTTVTCT